MRNLVATLVNQVARPPVAYAPRQRFSSIFKRGDAEAQMQAYGAVGTLFAIVSQIANDVATTAWHLYRRPVTQGRDRREIMPGQHAFLDRWTMPNPFYTGRFFRETCQQHLDLVGECVILLVRSRGFILEMWPVRPDRIEPVPHPTKFLNGYVYTGPGGEQVPLELDEVIHIKMPNPLDPYRGMGPVQTVLADIDSSRFSAEWNRNFFVNGARPGGIIQLKDRMLSDTQWKILQDRWREQHQGISNAHRVAVIEMGEWKDVNFNMQDMQFIELRNLPRELIREAFSFPKPMLGTVDDVNRANALAGKTIKAEVVTVPRLDRWKDIVNAKLLPMYQTGRTLELDYDNPVPKDNEEEDRERNSIADAARRYVQAGWEHDDVADYLGFPRMRVRENATVTSGGPNG